MEGMVDPVHLVPLVPPEDAAAAERAYGRLVRRFEERTGRPGVHWEELSSIEREYWTRVWLVLRG